MTPYTQEELVLKSYAELQRECSDLYNLIMFLYMKQEYGRARKSTPASRDKVYGQIKANSKQLLFVMQHHDC